jgi:DNA-directed RNA polymerase specialized sigma24 family protein
MSDSSSVGARDQVSEAWRSHRPYLVNLAYQMLGDVGEAEDIAQEAFLRLARTNQDEIDDIRGWLTVGSRRLCLDQVRSVSKPTDDLHLREAASTTATDLRHPDDIAALGVQVSCRYVAGGIPTSRLNALRKATAES